jgi:uncharacterized membrane protein
MTTLLPIIGALAVLTGIIFGIIKAKTKSERIIYLAGLVIILGFGIYGSVQMKKKIAIATHRFHSIAGSARSE